MSYFTIDPGTDHVPLDAGSRAGSVVFSVQNKTGVARQVRAVVVVDDPAQEDWYTVREPVRDARVDESVQFPVDVAVPQDAEAGTYGFRLRVLAEDDPDDVYEESQRLRVDAPEPKPADGSFPWWVVAVVAAVLLVGGVVGVLALTNGDGPGTGDEVTTPDIRAISPAPEDSPFDANDSEDGQEFLRTTLEVDVLDDDPEDALDIVWINSRGNEPIGTGVSPEVRLSAGCPRSATHEIEVLVIDTDDNVARDSTTVTVERQNQVDRSECFQIPDRVIQPLEPLDPDMFRPELREFPRLEELPRSPGEQAP